MRSKQLFKENIYGKGIIGRFVTNVINTGLTLEATPEQSIIGWTDDQIEDWSEATENRFKLWGSNPKLCDFMLDKTFGGIQAAAYMEALISGDVLVLPRYNKMTGLPSVQLISGSLVQSPAQSETPRGSTIKHGVELDKDGRHIAFWVLQEDGKTKRVAAYEGKTGRRLAWLLYGSDNMMDDVRGEPLLSVVLQSLKEIDRYRDSAQRKAVVNSLVAMFIQRDEETVPSLPMTGGAKHNSKVQVTDSGTAAQTRTIQSTASGAGQVWEGLERGEKPVLLGGNGTDVNFHTFEDAIISAISWCYGIPPEIVKLAFTNNYSASQAALNEFKIWLNFKRKILGDTFCSPIYEEWCLGEALNGTFNAPGFLESWRNPNMFYEYTAWIQSDWTGAIKPTTDILKAAKGFALMEEKGWVTNDRIAKELTGMKYSKIQKKRKRENQQRVEAKLPILEAEQKYLTAPSSNESVLSSDTQYITLEDAEEMISNAIETYAEEITNV
jgi:capsid protein